MPANIEDISILLLKARENTIASIKPVLNHYALTEQQWRVIRVLSDHDEISAQQLAEESCILSPSLSRILARLTTEKVVLRKVDSQDQRAQSIRLSAKGKRLHDKIIASVDKRYRAISKALGKEKIADLKELLDLYAESHPEPA